jgi:hypothetical protein
VVDNARHDGDPTAEPRRLALHWLLFFVIALGIGYPAVSRFDPRTVAGCADAGKYYEMVVGEPARRASSCCVRSCRGSRSPSTG